MSDQNEDVKSNTLAEKYIVLQQRCDGAEGGLLQANIYSSIEQTLFSSASRINPVNLIAVLTYC